MGEYQTLFNNIKESSTKQKEGFFNFIQQYGKKVAFEVDDIVVREGAPASEIFIILDGKVEVSTIDEHKSKIVITHLGRGTIIGEMALFLEQKRSATITAVEKVVAVKFTLKSFINALTSVPDLLIKLLQSFSGKIEGLNKKLAKTIDKADLLKLAAFLLEQSQGEKNSVDVTLSSLELAAILGMKSRRIEMLLEYMQQEKALSQLYIGSNHTFSAKLAHDRIFSLIKGC